MLLFILFIILFILFILFIFTSTSLLPFYKYTNCGNKIPTRCNRWVFIVDLIACSTCFGAPLCPSSGAREYYTSGCCLSYLVLGFQAVGIVWRWGLCVRFAGCNPQTGHTTRNYTLYRQLENQAPNMTNSNHLYNTLELLMMGIMVPKTCWTSNKIYNKNSSVASSWHFISTYYRRCTVKTTSNLHKLVSGTILLFILSHSVHNFFAIHKQKINKFIYKNLLCYKIATSKYKDFFFKSVIFLTLPVANNVAPAIEYVVFRMMLSGETEVLEEKLLSMPLCSPKFFTCTDLVSNLGLRGDRPATNRLSHGTATSWKAISLWYSNLFSQKQHIYNH
jgi:hypothetical protein